MVDKNIRELLKNELKGYELSFEDEQEVKKIVKEILNKKTHQ